MPTKEQVLSVLKTVMDFDLNQDLVSLGMIEKLAVEGSSVSLEVILTTPSCPLKQKSKRMCARQSAALMGLSTFS